MTEEPAFLWRPGIGDPTLVGWVTVWAYVIAAGICLWAARADAHPSRRRWWTLLCLFLVALGLNKQLDLQSALTEIGRWLAWRFDWYDNRRYVQVAFLAAIALVGVGGLGFALRRMRTQLAFIGPSILGLFVTLVFVLARASSFHKMDALIGFEPISGVRMNWILELCGIGLTACGALWGRRQALRVARADTLPPEPEACEAAPATEPPPFAEGLEVSDPAEDITLAPVREQE